MTGLTWCDIMTDDVDFLGCRTNAELTAVKRAAIDLLLCIHCGLHRSTASENQARIAQK